MSRKVEMYGLLHENGGALFVASGMPPNASVKWTLTGYGTLKAYGYTGAGTRWKGFSNANGVAIALYSTAHPTVEGDPPPNATAGDTITVKAEAHVDA